MDKKTQTSKWSLLSTEPFTETMMNHKRKKKKGTPVYSDKLVGKTHYTALLKSVCKWDIQLCSDIKAPLHIPSLVLFCVLSVFKREWRRFKTAAILQRIMLCLCPLPNEVSKPVYFSWKEVQRSANGESVSSFKVVDFCHFHPRCQFLTALAQQNSSRIVWNMLEK